jgi:endonuclease/exonuclease/phosphatase (EEP) superfamily protein YafD
MTQGVAKGVVKGVQGKFSRLLLKAPLAWICFITICATTLLGVLTSQYGWPIYLEIFSHFQVQYLIFALFLLCVLWLTHRKSLFMVGLLFCAILFIQVVPPWYLPPRQLFPQGSANLRVFVANINTQNKSYEQVLSLVRKESPDLAIFIEVSDAWVAQLNSLGDFLPYSFGQANPYNSGLVVFSRNPLINPSLEFFGKKGTASIVANLEVNSQRFALMATHPLPPAKPSFFRSRNEQLAQVGDYLQTLTSPILLVGDLNLTMWSPYYKQLIQATGLESAREGFGILPTWPTSGTYSFLPAFLPLLFSIPIDHCLHSPELKTIDIRTGAPNGSDHRPLIVDLQINPGNASLRF